MAVSVKDKASGRRDGAAVRRRTGGGVLRPVKTGGADLRPGTWKNLDASC
jgi:hypothetical protein